MATLTNRSDVINNFVRYHGRQPNQQELAPGGVVEYLMTKVPQEVEQLLAKNSPITGGRIWSEYQASLSQGGTSEGTTGSTTGGTAGGATSSRGQATLYGPDGQREVVDVGSERASELQSQGWGLTPGSYTGGSGGSTEADPQAQLNQEILKYIDSLDLDDSYKVLLRGIVAQSATTGTKFYTPDEIDSLLRDISTQVELDIGTYYDKIDRELIEDLQNKIENIRGQAERYQEQSGAQYKQKVSQTQQNLRARGLTWSGAQRKTLGKEGAIDSAGREGEIPEARRFAYQNVQAGLESQLDAVGLDAERKLGSERMGVLTKDLGAIPDPYGSGRDYSASAKRSVYTPLGTTTRGQYELDRKRDYEREKWNRLSNLAQYN